MGERGESEGGTTYRVNNMKPNVYGFFFTWHSNHKLFIFLNLIPENYESLAIRESEN